jgi:ATP-dependent Clp protease ATP-binding subunit ClpB
VEIQIEGLRKRLAERRVSLDLDPGAIQHIARTSYDAAYGARPLKRYIQRHIETELGRKIIRGEVPDGSRVRIGRSGEDLEFRVDPL